MNYKNSDGKNSPDAKHPSSTSEVGRRLGAIVSLYPSKKAAADMAGVSPDQLARYIKGQNQAPFEVLSRVALKQGVDLNWLATGEGQMVFDVGDVGRSPGQRSGEAQHQSHDEELMRQIGDAISRVYKEENIGIGAGQLTSRALRIYSDLVDFSLDERPIALKGMLAQLRRDLRQPPSQSTEDKRLA